MALTSNYLPLKEKLSDAIDYMGGEEFSNTSKQSSMSMTLRCLSAVRFTASCSFVFVLCVIRIKHSDVFDH